jgi:probable HAF family extracellular repeat protein
MRKGIWTILVIGLTLTIVNAQTKYTVVDLGTLGGTGAGCAHGINMKTQIAGISSTPEDASSHLFLWQKGSMTDLGTLGISFNYVGTMGMNINTEIVGSYYLEDWSFRAYLWRKGNPADLGTLGGSTAFAEGINDFTQIVGGSFLSDNATVRAFVWLNGTMFNLPVRFGGPNSVAHGINDFGQIIGESETADPTGRGFNKFNAFLWQFGSQRPLPTLGGELTAAFAMNLLGHVVGLSETNVLEPTTGWPLSHAYLWRNGVMTDLGTIPGDNASHANQVNIWDQVVGTSSRGINMVGGAGLTLPFLLGFSPDCSAFQYQWGSCFDWGVNAHGFLWQKGKMYNLDDLIPANSGWHLIAGDAINDLGQIVAAGYKDGDPSIRSCLLRPKK